MVDISTFGTTPAGDEVHAYTLTAGEVSVRVMDFGATLLGAKVPDRAGDAADIVLGFGALDGYLNNPACYGCTVGPSANRSDRAEVPLGDTVCQLPKKRRPRPRQQPAYRPRKRSAQTHVARGGGRERPSRHLYA